MDDPKRAPRPATGKTAPAEEDEGLSAYAQTISDSLSNRSILSDDVKLLLDCAAGFAGLGLFVKMRETDDEDQIAWTDGIEVCVGKRYFALPLPQRLGVLTHEFLHVGLAHPLRGKRLRANETDYDHPLFRIATDAVINHAIGALHQVQLPGNGVRLWRLEAEFGVVLSNKSAEQIYALLKSKRDSAFVRDILSDSGCCLGIPTGEFDPDSDNEAIESWNFRTTSAALAGVAERIRCDIPKVTTPWNAITKSFVRRTCTAKTTNDYRRPHRRWLGTQPIASRTGFLNPMLYGKRQKRAGRLAVVADSSGSIDGELLGRMTGEIIAVIEQTQAVVRLIVCDAEVRSTDDFDGKNDIARLRRFQYRGGGGTDFAPAIAAAAEWQPDALIYLTDLYGNFGPKPKFPVLWAVCPGGSPERPPFGQRIDLV
jgi:predicted metal-dependent peptidase